VYKRQDLVALKSASGPSNSESLWLEKLRVTDSTELPYETALVYQAIVGRPDAFVTYTTQTELLTDCPFATDGCSLQRGLLMTLVPQRAGDFALFITQGDHGQAMLDTHTSLDIYAPRLTTRVLVDTTCSQSPSVTAEDIELILIENHNADGSIVTP